MHAAAARGGGRRGDDDAGLRAALPGPAGNHPARKPAGQSTPETKFLLEQLLAV